MRKSGGLVRGVLGVVCIAALGACGSPETALGSGGDGGAIVIGSQAYYSNEIIAEIYAQALEQHDFKVDRQFLIGQREVYMEEIEQGFVDLFPEYSGPLLQYLDPTTQARSADDVYAALGKAVPEGLQVLEQSAAADQDSYVVTEQAAQRYGLDSIGDLANIDHPVTLGANSEAEHRPNGPRGLEEFYGVQAKFTPIEDSGGPLTVKALRDGDIDVAILYSADPGITKNQLRVLEDPKGQFLAANVVPIASSTLDPEAAAVINEVNQQLTVEGLRELNARSVEEQLPASTIAKEWLAQR